MNHLLKLIVNALVHILTDQEKIMADFTKLNQDIADLSAKVDALLAKQNPPPVDEQPQVDQAAAAVEAIAAKIPA
jgi:hypothetical protein